MLNGGRYLKAIFSEPFHHVSVSKIIQRFEKLNIFRYQMP